jgi:hypothetical protein
VTGTGLLAGTVAAHLADRDPQLLQQPRHHGARDGGHVIRDVPPAMAACTAAPPRPARFPPRNLRTNVSSVGASVKYLISSARAGSGNRRSCASSSSENTSLVAAGAPSPEEQNPMENTQPARNAHAQPNLAIQPRPVFRYLAVILIVVFFAR